MADCTCDDYGNTGQGACITLPKEASQIFLAPLFKSDGSRYSIPFANVNNAGLTTLINEVNVLDRLYPSLEVKNPESPRSDAKFEVFSDDSKVFLVDGIKSMKYWFPDGTYTHLGRLQSFECKRMGLYVLDKSNNLIGEKGALATDIYPFEIAFQSMRSKWMDPTGGSTSSKIEMVMDLATSQRDSDSIIISNTDLIANDLSGLLTVQSDWTTVLPTTTTFTGVFTLTDYSVPTPIPVEGVLLGELSAFNITQTAAEPLTSVTPGVAGTYAFVTTGLMTSGDEIRVTLAKEGLDGSSFLTNLITIP